MVGVHSVQISELIEAARGQTARGPQGNEGQGAGNEAGLSRPGSVLGANSKLAQSGATDTQGGFLETNGNAVVSPAGKQGGERRAGEGACETLYGRGGEGGEGEVHHRSCLGPSGRCREGSYSGYGPNSG